MVKVAPDSKYVVECVKHGGEYAIYDGKTAYLLRDQKTPERFAAQKVRITRALYEKTKILKVDSISAEVRWLCNCGLSPGVESVSFTRAEGCPPGAIQ